MAFTKFAKFESSVLEVKGSAKRAKKASLDKFSEFDDYRTENGYLYARIRAISSRVNKNHDGWPSVELAGSQDIFDRHTASTGFTVESSDNPYGFSTFLGKPIFVDHNNSNPSRARGVIVDAKLHVEDFKTATHHDPYYSSSSVDNRHLPPTWVELLLEVDAKSFPKLAKAIIEGSNDPDKGIDGFSMGCNVERSVCSHCSNVATNPDEYCDHIRSKGTLWDYKHPKTGMKTARKSYENCEGIQFFEISAVFDPADETALLREVRSSVHKEANLLNEPSGNIGCPKCEGQGFGRDMRDCPDCDGTGMKGYTNQPGGDGAYTPGRLGPNDMDLDVPQDPYALLGPRRQGKTAAVYGEDPFSPPRDPLRDDHAVDDEALKLIGLGVDEETAMEMAEKKVNNPIPGAGDGEIYQPKRDEYSDPPGDMPPARVIPRDQRDENEADPGFWEKAQRLLDEAHPNRPTMNDPRWSHNEPEPQADLLHAPKSIDTLREEKICPVCGEVMDSEVCDLCGNVLEPEGFDNPDLSKAQQRDVQQDPNEVKPMEESELMDKANPQQGPTPPSQSPTNIGPVAHVTTDMARWQVLDHTAGVINPIERPIKPDTKPATDEPDETIISDPTSPVTSSVRTAAEFMAIVGRNNNNGENMKTADAASGAPAVATPDVRTDVTGVGGVDQASNEEASKADAQINVEGMGGTGVENVSPDSTNSIDSPASPGSDDSGYNTEKNIEAIHTDTWGPNEGDSLGQAEPVQGDVFPSSEEAVKHSHDSGPYPSEDGGLGGGTPVQGVQPGDPAFKPLERVNLFEPQTSPANNSGPTKTWSGTDGNGVTKQLDPVTNETLEGSDLVNLHSGSKAHMMSAFRLADLEVELGLIGPDRKYARVAELEQTHPGVVIASLQYANRVKTAGFSRQPKVARKLPSLGRSASTVKETTVEETAVTDAGLFL